MLRDGPSRRDFLGFPGTFYAPELLEEKASRHAEAIAARSHMHPDDVRSLLARLLARIRAVPRPTYEPFLEQANAALGRRDPNDIAYLACALAVGANAIWSHDRDFDAQTLVPRIADLERLDAG